MFQGQEAEMDVGRPRLMSAGHAWPLDGQNEGCMARKQGMISAGPIHGKIEGFRARRRGLMVARPINGKIEGCRIRRRGSAGCRANRLEN